MYLRDDPLLGAHFQHHSELRVPSAEKAAFYLDAAVAARTRTSSTPGEEARDSHLLYTLHVYQYSVDKSGKGGGMQITLKTGSAMKELAPNCTLGVDEVVKFFYLDKIRSIFKCEVSGAKVV